MRTMHDHDYRQALRNRVHSLTPDAPRKWGQMHIDQMLWHVNGALEVALDPKKAATMKMPIPKPVVKFIVLNLPWGKNGPTMPEIVAKERYDFETERARTLALMDELAARDVNGPHVEHPAFGKMTGHEVSKLQAKHVDHHLRQFGA